MPTLSRFLLALFISKAIVVVVTDSNRATAEDTTIRKGLVAQFEFNETKGSVIHDSSGFLPPMHLEISDPNSIEHTPQGLRVIRPTEIRSTLPAQRLTAAVQRTSELTLEAWLTPRSPDQSGPARIATLSLNPTQRSFTLGQEGKQYDLRFRTSSTTSNGTPSTASKAVIEFSKQTHVAVTRRRDGTTSVFIDGKLNAQQHVTGTVTDWDPALKFSLANEVGGGRPWLGEFQYLAIYARALRAEEIRERFEAGPNQAAEKELVNQNVERFRTQIAPLLAEHCLECHDAAVREGGLDLSHKATAFESESGATVVAKHPDSSLLLERLEDDSMPADRPPLTQSQKELIRQWIADGADWSMDFIDPVLFLHGDTKRTRWVRRLTRDEYINTVAAVTGVDIKDAAERLLPPDLRADGFSNTAYNLNVDLGHVNAYAELAHEVVKQVNILEFAGRFSKVRRFTDNDMGALIEAMGMWVLRGPLSKQEVISYRGITTTVAASGGKFDQAVSLLLEAMLQSPRFIYLVENQSGDGNIWPVTPTELACRMSYIVWGAPPDAELYAAAESGDLLEPEKLRIQLDRMLKDPRARSQASRFVIDWLNLTGLDNLNPGQELAANWDPKLPSDMRSETIAFFDEIAWNQNQPLTNLLTEKVTYLTPNLAKHYGVSIPAKEASDSNELIKIEFPEEDPRGGLLTHASVLTIGGDEASMVSRGLFVMHHLLRGVVRDPPPCVDTSPVPTKPGLTQRDVALSRIGNEACGGCHARFEPLAFAFEKFDGIGRYREVDTHGNSLFEDGNVLVPGDAEPIRYETVNQFKQLMAAHDRVAESLTWKLTQFALGRPLNAKDAPIVKRIHSDAMQHGGTYRATIIAILESDLVQADITEIVATQ